MNSVSTPLATRLHYPTRASASILKFGGCGSEICGLITTTHSFQSGPQQSQPSTPTHSVLPMRRLFLRVFRRDLGLDIAWYRAVFRKGNAEFGFALREGAQGGRVFV